MEIDITYLLDAECVDLSDYSASIAERGQTAGHETWQASLEEAGRAPLVADAGLDEVRDYFAGFGAWDDAERAGWTPYECNALLLQFIAGDLREALACCPGEGEGVDAIDWTAYEREASKGQLSGNIYRSGVRAYFTLSD